MLPLKNKHRPLDEIRIVPRPLRGVLYGIAWLIIALSIGAVLTQFTLNGTSLFDTEGQRTAGFIISLPFIAFALSILCFIQSGRRVTRYKAYIQHTTPAQRAQLKKDLWKTQGPPMGLLVLFTTIAYLGFLGLILILVIHHPTISVSVNGLGLFIGVLSLIGVLAAFLTELFAQKLRWS